MARKVLLRCLRMRSSRSLDNSFQRRAKLLALRDGGLRLKAARAATILEIVFD